jgi:hypothetical protein
MRLISVTCFLFDSTSNIWRWFVEKLILILFQSLSAKKVVLFPVHGDLDRAAASACISSQLDSSFMRASTSVPHHTREKTNARTPAARSLCRSSTISLSAWLHGWSNAFCSSNRAEVTGRREWWQLWRVHVHASDSNFVPSGGVGSFGGDVPCCTRTLVLVPSRRFTI